MTSALMKPFWKSVWMTPAASGAVQLTNQLSGYRLATTVPAAGAVSVMVRCTNSDGLVQPVALNWNPSGFMHNAIETLHLRAA